MRRYLTLSEAEFALSRGKEIEQFLGGFLAYGDPAIRYAVVRVRNEKFVATVHEKFEPSQEGFYDVVEFSPVAPDDDPIDHPFDSFKEAVSFLTDKHRAAAEKFVNQGLVQDEYRDYRGARKIS